MVDNLIVCEEYPHRTAGTHFSGKDRQREGAAGVAKHLEFPAGGD